MDQAMGRMGVCTLRWLHVICWEMTLMSIGRMDLIQLPARFDRNRELLLLPPSSPFVNLSIPP